MTNEGAFLALVGLIGILVVSFIWLPLWAALLILFGMLFVVGAES